MEPWLARLLDSEEDDHNLRGRVCLVADYLRALRLIGSINAGLEGAWRRLSLTVDPLVSGAQAVGQLRTFLEVAERELGPIPNDFPQASFQVHTGDDDVQAARPAWADNVMAALLDIGTARRINQTWSRWQHLLLPWCTPTPIMG